MPSFNQKRGILRFSDTGAGTASATQQPWVFDPSNAGSNITASDNFKTASFTGTFASIRGSTAVTEDCYFEVEYDAGAAGNVQIGIGNTSATLTDYPGKDNNGIGLYASDGTLYRNDGSIGSYSSLSAGDVLKFAVIFSTGEVFMGIAGGAWFNSGNPEAATGEVSTISGTLYPLIGGRTNAVMKIGDLIDTPPTGFAILQ